MSMPRATSAQTHAIRNLMFSTENIDYVLTYMIRNGKRYLAELSLFEAKEIIGVLVKQ